ncbi:unnamed protein product [Malus baccata var. baccata]
MDPPLINESSSSVANPASYSLAEIWSFSGEPGGSGGGLGLRVGNLGQSLGGLGDSSVNRDGSLEESTVTEQSGGGGGGGRKRRDVNYEDESSKRVSTRSGSGLKDLGKRMKLAVSRNENDNLKAEVEESSAGGDSKPAEESTKPSEPPKQDYIHVRARRGQATDSHSLAERARREKISERMKVLQDLVPGCNKVIGKALVLDEIINYIQSLQNQFLSMKLEAVNSRVNMNPTIEAFPPKDLGAQPFDVAGLLFSSHTPREYAQSSQPEWLHMQVGGSFDRAT